MGIGNSSAGHEIVQEFSSELAGQRVGWVAVTDFRDEPDNKLVSVDMVCATVGKDGARQGFQNRELVDGEVLFIPEQEGFLCVSAISALFSPGKSHFNDEFNMYYIADANPRGTQGGGLLSQGLSRLPESKLMGLKTWANSKPELLEILKGNLKDKRIGDEYARVYYWLNGTLLRGDEKSSPEFSGIDINDLLLADPNMESQTAEQLFHSTGITNELTTCIGNDEKMKKRLTVFSDIPAREIPQTFIESRKFAHDSELRIRQNAANLAVQRLVYLPIGVRPSGRSWPYMDAGEHDEEKAFGRELVGLKKQSITLADYELEKELRELNYRRDYATSGRQRFAALLHAEQTA